MDRENTQAPSSAGMRWGALICLLALPQVGCLNNWTAPAVIPDDPSAQPVPRPSNATAPREIPTPTVVQNDTLRIPASVGLPSAETRAYPVTQASDFAPLANGGAYGPGDTEDPVVGMITDEASPRPPQFGTGENMDDPLQSMGQMFGGEVQRLPGADLPPDVKYPASSPPGRGPEGPWGDPPAMDTSNALPSELSPGAPATANLPEPPAINSDLPAEVAEFGPASPQVVTPDDVMPGMNREPQSIPEIPAVNEPPTVEHGDAEPIRPGAATAGIGDEAPAESATDDPTSIDNAAPANEDAGDVSGNTGPSPSADDVPEAEPVVLTAAESLVQTLDLLRAEVASGSGNPLDAKLLDLLEVVAHPESQWPERSSETDEVWKAVATAASLELRGASVDRRLEQLGAAETVLRQQAPLKLSHLTFCKQIDDYGSYSEFDADAFSPGQELLLYVELAHFAHRQVEQGYVIEIEGGYEVVDKSGNVVESREFLADKQTFRNTRRDYYVPYRLYVPEKIADGEYSLRLKLKDRTSGKSGTGSIVLPVRRTP